MDVRTSDLPCEQKHINAQAKGRHASQRLWTALKPSAHHFTAFESVIEKTLIHTILSTDQLAVSRPGSGW
jgi:hypothetical protein